MLDSTPQIVGGTFESPQSTPLEEIDGYFPNMDSASICFFRTEVGICELERPKTGEGGLRAMVVTIPREGDTLYGEGNYRPDNGFYDSFGMIDSILGKISIFASGLGTPVFPFHLSGSDRERSLEEIAKTLPSGFQLEYYRSHGIWIQIGAKVYHWDGTYLT